MAHLQATKDYSKFDLCKFNRDVRTDTRQMKALKESMRKHGYLDAYPIHCVRNGGDKLLIKAGHHRFMAAQELGLAVKFVIEENDDTTIFELEGTTSAWSVKDYLEGFVRNGKPEYIKIREFHRRTNIPLSTCLGLLIGNSSPGNYTRAFKTGTYRVVGQEFAERVARLCDSCKGICKVSTDARFVEAMARVAMIPSFIDRRFCQSAKKHGGSIIKKAATIAQYTEMIEAVYNYHTGEKSPLTFLADEEARKRKAADNSR